MVCLLCTFDVVLVSQFYPVTGFLSQNHRFFGPSLNKKSRSLSHSSEVAGEVRRFKLVLRLRACWVCRSMNCSSSSKARIPSDQLSLTPGSLFFYSCSASPGSGHAACHEAAGMFLKEWGVSALTAFSAHYSNLQCMEKFDLKEALPVEFYEETVVWSTNRSSIYHTSGSTSCFSPLQLNS